MTLEATDVAVIGGGIMGCAVALRLAQRGVSVTVVERAIPGAEASSAAAGILGPQMEAEGPGPLLDLGLMSRALYPSLANELHDATGIDVGYDRSGVLLAALDDAGEAELAARLAWQQERGAEGRAARGRGPRRTRAGAGTRRARRAAVPRRCPGQRARAGARVLAGGGGAARVS
jgi:glycine oxidase